MISYPGELVISLWIFQLEYILRKYGYWINVLSLMAVGNYIMTVDYKDSPGSTNNSDASNNIVGLKYFLGELIMMTLINDRCYMMTVINNSFLDIQKYIY